MAVDIEWTFNQRQLARDEGSTSLANDYRYLWLKTVTGFIQSVHCASCLKGKYSKVFGLLMEKDKLYNGSYEEGTLLYFCGVSRRYNWNNNLHLAGSVKHGSAAEVVSYTGDRLIVNNFERIEFDSTIAEKEYSRLGSRFLTCRNFQFAAQMSAEGRFQGNSKAKVSRE